MKRNPCSEAASLQSGKESSLILWNPEFHFLVHFRSLVHFLSRISPCPSLLKVHFSMFFPSISTSSKQPVCLCVWARKRVCAFVPHVCHMPSSSDPLVLDHLITYDDKYKSWNLGKCVHFYVTSFSPSPNILLCTQFSKSRISCFNTRGQVSHL